MALINLIFFFHSSYRYEEISFPKTISAFPPQISQIIIKFKKKNYFNEANSIIPIKINFYIPALYTILTRFQYKCCTTDWALITLLENQCNVYYYEYENRTQRINCLFCLRFCIQNASIKKN